MMRLLVLLGFLSTSCAAAEWHGRILDARTRQDLSLSQLAGELRAQDSVILAEKHNTQAVQEAQAEVIRATGGARTVAWEFLDHSASEKTAASYSRFISGEIDAKEFLIETQGHAKYANYVPILEAARDLGASLIGVNLSRQEKAPVVEKGIGAADPALVPPGFELGSAGYLERFTEAMGEHSSPEKVANYFAAQCLTDDVMAFHSLASAAPRFLVAGSFHADYFDGAAARFRARAPGEKLSVVKFVDASDYTAPELLDLLSNPKYGTIADYAYFVNEPKRLKNSR